MFQSLGTSYEKIALNLLIQTKLVTCLYLSFFWNGETFGYKNRKDAMTAISRWFSTFAVSFETVNYTFREAPIFPKIINHIILMYVEKKLSSSFLWLCKRNSSTMIITKSSIITIRKLFNTVKIIYPHIYAEPTLLAFSTAAPYTLPVCINNER